jgi:hypothetical protein
MIAMELADDINPPVGWAQSAKAPPGWRNPIRRAGSGIRGIAFVSLLFGALLSAFGNWAVTEPLGAGSVDRTAEGDTILGIAALLLLIGATLMVISLVVSYRSRRTS